MMADVLTVTGLAVLVYVLLNAIFPLAFAVFTKYLPTCVKVAAIKCCATIGACCAVIVLYLFKRRLRRKIANNSVCQFFKELAKEFIESETYSRCYDDAYKFFTHAGVPFFFRCSMRRNPSTSQKGSQAI
jgi:hypothetical protein